MHQDGKVLVNGEGLKSIREERGYSRQALANLALTTPKTIRLMETKPGYRANPVTISELSKALDVKASRLIESSPELSPPMLLRTADEVIQWNTEIASAARRILLCVGSRSRDVKYLKAIETTLSEQPSLVHYRIMSWPPFKMALQQHLLRVLDIRDPTDRRFGEKKIHIGLYRDLAKAPEYNFCANETMALIVLPSCHSLGEYNTALLIQNPHDVDALLRAGKTLYQLGQPVETKEEIIKLGLVPGGEWYE